MTAAQLAFCEKTTCGFGEISSTIEYYIKIHNRKFDIAGMRNEFGGLSYLFLAFLDFVISLIMPIGLPSSFELDS